MRSFVDGSAMVLLALAALCACPAVSAQGSVEEEARVQFDTGVELFEAGQYPQASVAFARAYELRPSYKILYLVGKCESAQGHFALSLDAFTRYLAEGDDKIDNARQEEVRIEIKKLNARVGQVAIETDTSGVTVFVDERRAGETPLNGTLFVDLGEHEIVLKQGVSELHREIVKVAGGQRVVVKAELMEKGAAPAATQEVAAPAKAANEPTASTENTREGSRKRVRGLLIGGIAALALGAGAGVMGGIFLSNRNDALDRADTTTSEPEYDKACDDAETDHAAMLAGFIGAGVLVAAGAVLVALDMRGAKKGETENAVSFRPTATGVAVEF